MKDYYQNSLDKLRILGDRFAKAHPMVAPLLSSQSADPDVERIMEGVAFLSGLIEQRLDNNFPEIVYTLLELTAPEILRPIPSQTIIKYTPIGAAGLQHQNRNALLKSVPIDGTSCTYSVARKCTILPIARTYTSLTSDFPKKAELAFHIEGLLPYKNWEQKKLDIYFDDNLARATQWMMILMRYTKKITLKLGLQEISIPTSSLNYLMPEEFSPDMNRESVLSSCAHIKSFFAFTSQFLFLRLENLNNLSPDTKSTKLSILFSLEDFPDLPDLTPSLLNVNVVPASNIFSHESVPISISHQQQDYRLVPDDDKNRQMEIYKIKEISGVQRGGVTKTYHSYSAFESRNLDNSKQYEDSENNTQNEDNVYSIRRASSPINGRMEYYVSIMYKNENDVNEHETLVSKLFCYHHSLTKRLRMGDITIPTDSSPAMATFTNIVPPSIPVPPPSDTNLLWQLFSHLHANLLSLASPEALKHFLSLLLPSEGSDATLTLFNQKRIASIVDFKTRRDEMLEKGRPISGQLLSLTVDSSGFNSFGELYLFANILEQSLNRFTTLNTYTKFELKDIVTGETLIWPPRLGKKLLI